MRPYAVMALSFHRRLIEGEWTCAEFAAGLAAAGIEGVEPATSLFAARPDLEAPFVEAVREAGLAMPAYDSLANFVSPEATERQAAVDSVRRDLERCAAWGIPYVMIAGSRKHPDLDGAACRAQVAEGMNACVEQAAAAGLVIGLESFGVALEVHASSTHLREVVDQCDPRVMTTFDMGNFVLGGDRPADLVDDWFDRIAHVHVKDFQATDELGAGLPSLDGRRYVGCRIGFGSAQMREVIARLAARGYTGALSLEMSGADGFAETATDLAALRVAAAGC